MRSNASGPFVGHVDAHGLHLTDEERDEGLHLGNIEEPVERDDRPSLQGDP